MRPGYNTTSVTLRIPASIYAEIRRRVREDRVQTEVILDALCRAFEIPHPRPRKPKDDRNPQT